MSAAIGSIILSAKGDKATLEIFGGTNESAPTNQWDIYVGTIDGANLVQVTNDAYPDEVPQFNPAGTKVIFSSSRPIGDSNSWVSVIRNIDGTGEQVLSQPLAAEDSWHASYSPYGMKIAVEAMSMSANPPYDGIVLMNADGSNATLLTNPYGEGCWCWDEDPYFTTDGTQIVFSRENNDLGTEDVYIVKSDGTGVTKLTDGIGVSFDPLVIYDKTLKADRILFSSNRDNLTSTGSTGFELYSMKLDGTGLTRLTNNNVYDGFNLEYYEAVEASVSARRSPARQPWTPLIPAQRVRW